MRKIARRVGRYLERQGWLVRDAENDYLALDSADDDPLITTFLTQVKR